MNSIFKSAIILAAGFGKRMLPITSNLPKPLVKVANKPLIFHIIDKITRERIRNIFVNTHYLSEKLKNSVLEHYPNLNISRENQILETGGGVMNLIKTHQTLSPKNPLLVVNGDIFWVEKKKSLLSRLFKYWNDDMDILLLLQESNLLNGYQGGGDFNFVEECSVGKLISEEINNFAFCGVQILHPRIFKKVRKKNFSLRELYKVSMSKGSLYGLKDTNLWFHVSTPKDLKNVNQWLKKNEICNL